MKLTRCFLCGGEKSEIIHKGTRGGDKHIDVLQCASCGLVRLSEVMDDVEQFYQASGMRDQLVDTPAHTRITTRMDDERRFRFTENMIEGKDVLDFGCGDGGYLIRARKVARHVQGIELEKAMRDGLQEEGLSCCASLAEVGQFDVITLFHVLEHLDAPLDYLEKIRQHLTPDGMILIEVPNAEDALLSLYHSEAFADFTYWHCHVYLYNNMTLRRLAEKAGLKVKFMRQVQRYPLANHLYWLAQDSPGGHQAWAFLRDTALDERYGDMLAKLGIADTILAGFTV